MQRPHLRNRIILPLSSSWSASRLALLGLSAALALASALFPTEWYQLLPRARGGPPRPFDGTTLLRLTFLTEALVAAAFAITGWRPSADAALAGTTAPIHLPKDEDISRVRALVLLALVFVFAVLLRTFRMDLDLWLDEIATVRGYAARPLLEIFGSYLSPGNHLLNSLLVRISTSVFGVSEWSVRLPAVVFGIATIPAMYYAARLAMSRAASVGSALLLAVSYHHIFFSQNARGYSGYLFFILLGTALFGSVLRRESFLKWAAYVLVMSLSFAALMTAAFAFAAHVIVGAIALLLRRRRGLPVRPLVERLTLAFGAIGLLAFHIYAISIPDVIAIYPTVFNVQGSGYVFFSREFFAEIARGVSAGFAFGVAAIPLLAVGAAGFVILLRRSWVLGMGLLLSVAVTVFYLLLRGQSVAPRLLLPALPLAILSCMATVDALAYSRRRPGFLSRIPSRYLSLGFCAVLTVASVLTLPGYYSAPKQPYRQTIRYLREAEPQSDVIVVFPGAGGFQYYLAREGVDAANYHYVMTMAEYDLAMRSSRIGRGVLATTLFRVLRSTSPPLAEKIEEEWVPVRSFRGTLGDGGITLWRKKAL